MMRGVPELSARPPVEGPRSMTSVGIQNPSTVSIRDPENSTNHYHKRGQQQEPETDR